jgi:protein ImuB
MSASSASRRRILSLWLPHLPIDRIRRQSIAFSSEVGTGSRKENASNKIASCDAGQGDFPRVVVAKDHNAILLYAIDEAAVRAGLSIGLPLANARAICPELTVYDADEAADRKTLEDVTVSRRWSRSTCRMVCSSTSPAAPICSAARRRCCGSSPAR